MLQRMLRRARHNQAESSRADRASRASRVANGTRTRISARDPPRCREMLRQGEESLWGLHSDVKRMRHPGDLRIRECPMCRPSGAGARASLGGANLAAMARRAYACAAVGGASVPCVCAHHSTGAMGAGAVAGAGAGPGLAPELLRRGGSAWFAAVRSGNFREYPISLVNFFELVWKKVN
jgi:hypothetical protein